MLPPPPPGPSTWRDLPVGSRVAVRRRIPATEQPGGDAERRPGGHRWTDVIGVVLAVDDDGLRLRRDSPRRDTDPGSAPELTVPAGDIVTVKQIPPRPTRRPPAR